MPIRIYALAKELKLDSKELVDLCAKAGITGKGSALASLSDEEVAKVKSHITGSRGAAAKPAAEPGAPVRAATPERKTPPRIAPVKAKPSSKPAAPEPPPAPEPPAPTRRDSLHGAGERKIKVFGAGGKKSEGPKGDSPPPEAKPTKSDHPAKGEKPEKKEPVVRMAAVPKSASPAPTKKEEPTAQAPVMRLPQDAIKATQAGKKAPLEAFTKQQDTKRRAEEQTESKKSADTPLSKSGRRRGGRAAAAPAEGAATPGRGLAGMAGGRAARQANRKRRRVRDDDDGGYRGMRRRLVRKGTNTAAPRKGNVTLEVPCTIKAFSEATGISASKVLLVLMKQGVQANINAMLDEELAQELALEFEVEIDFKQQSSLEQSVLTEIEQAEDDPESLEPRPPVVTFLGHVDHGKTSLLDRIIGTDVVKGEAGGITQHIRSYQVKKDNRRIAFVDTPGHEAFTQMRARGANVTDIAVLVVAADDGVMPQTEEAISHAKAAGVPIIVALNKIDLPGVDVNRILEQLSVHEIITTEWGGEVEIVKTSATTGEGIDDLLETILLTADVNEYKANPDRPAVGVCLEARQEAGRGVIANMIVQKGTLHPSDVLVCGGTFGRVKAMYDTLRPLKKHKAAGPSTPVHVTGLDKAPEAGESFFVLDDIAKAREIAASRQDRTRAQALGGHVSTVTFEELMRRLEEGRLDDTDDVVTINLIIRADVRGSLEALQKELDKLEHPEVQIKVLQKSVGGVTVADVELATASQAVIIAFNVIPDEAARLLADARGVEIRRYDIIYRVAEDLKALLEGQLKPEEQVQELGRALVKQVFQISRVGTIAGCQVLGGTIERGCRVRVNRDSRGIGDYPLDSLKREKDDVKEVRQGYECGIKLAGFNDLKEGDILEAYKIVEVARTL